MLLYFALGGGGVKSLFLSGSASFRPIVQGREGCKSCPRLQNILLSLVMIYPLPSVADPDPVGSGFCGLKTRIRIRQIS